eukprot:4073704-Amphidinium_carterae.1
MGVVPSHLLISIAALSSDTVLLILIYAILCVCCFCDGCGTIVLVVSIAAVSSSDTALAESHRSCFVKRHSSC